MRTSSISVSDIRSARLKHNYDENNIMSLDGNIIITGGSSGQSNNSAELSTEAGALQRSPAQQLTAYGLASS